MSKNVLKNPKYYNQKLKARKDCAGCGGEKTEPLRTPAEIENFLAEDLSPQKDERDASAESHK